MNNGKMLLFVCTGNTCRSFMAEVIAHHYQKHLGERAKNLYILSAGTYAFPDAPASAHAKTAMEENGLEVHRHKARPLDRALGIKADLILVMAGNHKKQVLQQIPETEGKVFLLKEFAQKALEPSSFFPKGFAGDVVDPYGLSLDSYRACARELLILVPCAVDRFLQG